MRTEKEILDKIAEEKKKLGKAYEIAGNVQRNLNRDDECIRDLRHMQERINDCWFRLDLLKWVLGEGDKNA